MIDVAVVQGKMFSTLKENWMMASYWSPLFDSESETFYFTVGLIRLSMHGMHNDYIPNRADSTEYYGLIEAIGDNNYKIDETEEGVSLTYNQGSIPVILNSIKDITITVEPQYVAEIPAGESVNELFDIYYSNIGGFDRSGYERPMYSYANRSWNYRDYDGTTITKSSSFPIYYTRVAASDTQAYSVDYIGQDIFFELLQKPDNPDAQYTFTFNVEFADGTVETQSIGPFTVSVF
jgi:hypothetical protein